MALKLSGDTKHAPIVHQLNGPVQHLQLRHVPSNWVIHSEDKGPDLAASVDSLRQRAVRQGYVVDDEFDVEDWRPITGWLTRSFAVYRGDDEELIHSVDCGYHTQPNTIMPARSLRVN